MSTSTTPVTHRAPVTTPDADARARMLFANLDEAYRRALARRAVEQAYQRDLAADDLAVRDQAAILTPTDIATLNAL